MTKVCVVRNDSLPQEQLRTEGVVAIGWDEIGAEVIGLDYRDVKDVVRQTYPAITERQTGNWSGQVWLFCSEMEQGDVVVAPSRHTGTVDLGVVTGPAYREAAAPVHKFRRPVEWVELGTRRSTLSELSQRGLKAQLTCYTHGSGEELRDIVQARREVDVDEARQLISERISGVKSTPVAPEPYEAILSSEDPIRALRERVGQPFAEAIFIQLHAAGRRDLQWKASSSKPRTAWAFPVPSWIAPAVGSTSTNHNFQQRHVLSPQGGNMTTEHDVQAPRGIDDAPPELRAIGQEFLRAISAEDSVFTPGRAIWTLRHAQTLEAAFVDRPDEGGRSFTEKLDDQLEGVNDEALQLFAELWYINLAPLSDYRPETKRHLIESILSKMVEPVTLPPHVRDAMNYGAFNGGVAFKTRRPFQLALLVKLAIALLSLDREDRAKALSAPRQWTAIVGTVTSPKEPAQRRAVSWLLFPEYFLPVVSSSHRAAIRQAFPELVDDNAVDLDEELFQIRSGLAKRHPGGSLYAPPIVDMWDPDRTRSGVPATPDKLHERARFKTPAYVTASAAIALVPEGHWSTYSDIGEVSGLTPGQVGEYLETVEHPSGYRIIKHDGTTYPKYGSVEAGWLPEGVTPRGALEAEGVSFDSAGKADFTKRVTAQDLRELLEASGLLTKATRRAWLVRGNNVNGLDLVPDWLRAGRATLSATSLREVAAGISRGDLAPIVDEDYAHASYSAKREKLDAFHNLLSRMQTGHLIVTVDAGKLHLGEVAGSAEYISDDVDTHLSMPVSWRSRALDIDALPEELQARLKVQRDVLDLTQQLSVLEELFERPVMRPGPTKLLLPDATEELAESLHVSREWLQECIELLNDRPQLIFYGPPGTGKTYIAQKLAKHVAGDKVRLVQFHPSYSYEDFFEGYRPTKEGRFDLTPGPMRRVVDSAKDNPSVAHVLIIDEMNRGNLAKVFGELYFLLEYREEAIELLYGEGDFNLPPNVFIMGTMNTADRSIALVDAAMRRRFAFKPLHPSEEPTNSVLRRWLVATKRSTRVADLLDELNSQILDEDFKIGPSYFMRPAVYDIGGLERTWRTSILPLLEEHHYGEMSTSEVAGRYGYESIVTRFDAQAAPQADASREATGEA